MMSEELKPLAWLVKHEMHGTEVTQQQCTEADRQYGWTETPLYTFEQLQGFNRLVDHPPTSNPVVDHETGNTSDKLRDAVEVWRDAYDAFTDFYHHTTEKDPARVIEADRQATRAALVAEIVAWLRKASDDPVMLAVFCTAANAIEAKWGNV